MTERELTPDHFELVNDSQMGYDNDVEASRALVELAQQYATGQQDSEVHDTERRSSPWAFWRND